jgi:hypothetical protein
MMHKSNQNNALRERNGLRILVAISLTIFLAGLGACTTNYTPGNGQPTGSGTYGTMPHASTYGSSSGTEGTKPQSRMIVAPDVITPMFSSSSEAAAVLAGHQGRFLGYANPGPPSPNYGNDIVTGQVVPPALIANPQSTVNSSISSPPTPVITSGVGGGGGGGSVVIGGGVSAAATSGVAAPAVVTGANSAITTINAPLASAAPIVNTPSTIVTPTNTATPASAGAFAAGPGLTTATVNSGTTAPVVATSNSTTTVSAANTNVVANQNTGILTPSVTSALTPSPTSAANPPVGNVAMNNATASANRATSVVTSPLINAPTTTGRARAVSQPAAITAPLTIPGRVARPVRMSTSSSGSVVITNQ